jgi:hypothetical protein
LREALLEVKTLGILDVRDFIKGHSARGADMASAVEDARVKRGLDEATSVGIPSEMAWVV